MRPKAVASDGLNQMRLYMFTGERNLGSMIVLIVNWDDCGPVSFTGVPLEDLSSKASTLAAGNDFNSIWVETSTQKFLA
jgi:hypothetical protein